MDDVGVRAEPYVIENGVVIAEVFENAMTVRLRRLSWTPWPRWQCRLKMMPMAWRTSHEALLMPPEEVAAALEIAQAAMYSSGKLVVSLD
ncbi:hypothetical protein PC119_g26422 [Phytophthora cactorum]|nr:hypothetical protein PC119_g26422 [Phytophthora cactorum]